VGYLNLGILKELVMNAIKIRKILLFIPGVIRSRKLLDKKRAALNINYPADGFASVLNGREKRLKAVS
jgi:hypothetical protein